MAIIKIMCRMIVLCICLFNAVCAQAEHMGPPQQVIQINTKFHNIDGSPSWLIILRDVETGQVLPYLYDIKNNDNFWIAFSLTHKYVVVSSAVKFDASHTLNNFCQLEGGILVRTSMFVSLTGDLTTQSATSTCHVLKYKQDNFPIVTSDDINQGTSNAN